MKFILVFLVCSLFVLQSFSQSFSIGFRAGLGTYSMTKLDQFQQYRTDQLEFPLKITDSYPITPYYRAELAVNDVLIFSKLATFISFYSTGARSTVTDYSGEVMLDAVINGNQFGLTMQRDLVRKHFGSIGLYNDVSYLFSTFKINDSFQLYDPYNLEESSNYSFVSSGFAFEPGLEYNYTLYPFNFQINLGYMFDFSKNLHLKDNKDQFLYMNNEMLKPQWSGFRVGLQASWILTK